MNPLVFQVSYKGWSGTPEDLAGSIEKQALGQGGNAKVKIRSRQKILAISVYGDDAFQVAYSAAIRRWFDNLD